MLDKVKSVITERINSDKQIKLFKKKKAEGKATLKEAIVYNSHIANIIGVTLSDFMPELEKDALSREYICREILRNQHKETNAMLSDVQRVIDEKLNLKIKPRTPDFPLERVEQISHSLVDATVGMETIQRRARSATENVINSFADDFVKENAEMRNDAGLSCYLTRYTSGKCCKWCDGLAGRYKYDEAPDDIYRRHDNCYCVVTFENGRMRQDVWSKKTWEVPAVEQKDSTPKKLSYEQGKAIEKQNLPHVGVDKSGGSRHIH